MRDPRNGSVKLINQAVLSSTHWESAAAKKESNFLVAICAGKLSLSSLAISATYVFNSRYLFAIALTVAVFALDFTISEGFDALPFSTTFFEDEHGFCDFARIMASAYKVSLNCSHVIAAAVAEVAIARKSEQWNLRMLVSS